MYAGRQRANTRRWLCLNCPLIGFFSGELFLSRVKTSKFKHHFKRENATRIIIQLLSVLDSCGFNLGTGPYMINTTIETWPAATKSFALFCSRTAALHYHNLAVCVGSNHHALWRIYKFKFQMFLTFYYKKCKSLILLIIADGNSTRWPNWNLQQHIPSALVFLFATKSFPKVGKWI